MIKKKCQYKKYNNFKTQAEMMEVNWFKME